MNASGRLNTCKSRGKRVAISAKTGARVSNAYATYPLQGDSPEKSGLIPHELGEIVVAVKMPLTRNGTERPREPLLQLHIGSG